MIETLALLSVFWAAIACSAPPDPKPVFQVKFELAVPKYFDSYSGEARILLEANVAKDLVPLLANHFCFLDFTASAAQDKITIRIEPLVQLPNKDNPVPIVFHLKIEGPRIRQGPHDFQEWEFRDLPTYFKSVKPEGEFRSEIVSAFIIRLYAALGRERLMDECFSHVELCQEGVHIPETPNILLPVWCEKFRIDVFDCKFKVHARVTPPANLSEIERLYEAHGNGRVSGGPHEGHIITVVESGSDEEVCQSKVKVLRAYLWRYRPVQSCGIVPPSGVNLQ